MPKTDDLVKKIDFFQRLALYFDRKNFLSAIAQDISAANSGYPSIPDEVQEMLSRIVTVEGLGLPIKMDGVLGPETRAALETFKKSRGLPPTTTDAQLFDAIRMQYQNDPQKYGI
jgi:peptidoglycan hydrolase-like protein with peptidoglycan-binding domain